ncbi:MAG: hypothetical protein CSA26_07120 [Desulfobacterales bacterium]|nr:MAG: hypothetical protein CSA26_07120 [Desulfobacterales bacterium]
MFAQLLKLNDRDGFRAHLKGLICLSAFFEGTFCSNKRGIKMYLLLDHDVCFPKSAGIADFTVDPDHFGIGKFDIGG